MTDRMVKLARKLRVDQTDAEKRIWYGLRQLNRQGFHFRRQAPIGPYIADFASHSEKIVVEIDGSQHLEADIAAADNTRSDWLASQRNRVLRFWANDALTNTEGVLQEILAAAEAARGTLPTARTTSSPLVREGTTGRDITTRRARGDRRSP